MDDFTLEKIIAERERQDNKWGADRMLDDHVWLTILTEEAGEAAEGILKRIPIDELEKEVVQIAAVAVAWIECLESKKGY